LAISNDLRRHLTFDREQPTYVDGGQAARDRRALPHDAGHGGGWGDQLGPESDRLSPGSTQAHRQRITVGEGTCLAQRIALGLVGTPARHHALTALAPSSESSGAYKYLQTAYSAGGELAASGPLANSRPAFTAEELAVAVRGGAVRDLRSQTISSAPAPASIRAPCNSDCSGGGGVTRRRARWHLHVPRYPATFRGCLRPGSDPDSYGQWLMRNANNICW